MSCKIRRAAGFVRRVFIGPRGLRGVWRAALACAAYYAWITLAGFLLTLMFARLFEAWAVNSLNLQIAPKWVRLLVSVYPYITSMLINIPAALALTRAARKMTDTRVRPSDLIWFLMGLGAVTISGILFLIADSMRLESRAAQIHWILPVRLIVYLAAAWSEQLLSRGYVFGALRRDHGRAVSYAASTAVFIVLTSAWNAGAIGFMNMLLMSVELIAITEKYGAWPAIALRTGWSWALNCLICFPGGGTGAAFTLYPVSEDLITGGNYGFISGLFATLILIFAVAALFKADIKRLFYALHQRRKMRPPKKKELK